MEELEISIEAQEEKIVEAVREYVGYYEDYAAPYRDYALKVHSMIHGDVDWGDKEAHHAKIHLNKLGVALDSFKATAKRGLMNFDEWMKVSENPLMKTEYLSESEAKRMVELLLRNEDPKIKVSDCLGLGFVENLCTLKIITKVEEIRGPGGKTYKSPRTTLMPLDIWDFGTDPDCVDFKENKPLYRFHNLTLPKHEILRASSEEGTIDKPYILSRVKELNGSERDDKSEQEIAKGKQILLSSMSRKKMINMIEFYGTILDEDGMIMEYGTGEAKMLLEDVRLTIADGNILIERPRKIQDISIDGADTFICHRLLRSNKDLLGRARAHAGYEINHILDEYTSAMADAGIKSGSNMTVYKPDMMLDPEEAAGGFTYDSNIAINSSANPADVVSTIRLGELPQTMFNVYNILDQSFAENLSTNSTALSGALPGKQVRATEVAAAQGTVGALEESVLMDVDDILIEGMILKIFRQGLNLAKSFNDLDLAFIFGQDEERIEQFKELRKSKSKLFEELGYTFRFKGNGLRGIANSARNGQMTMNLLTSALGNPMLIEILERRDWDLSKMLESGVKGMGIDPDTLKDPKVGELARERQNYREMGRGIADQNGQGGQQQQQGAVQPTQRETGDTEPGNNGA